MYWTLQNLKDSENKQYILHYGSIFSAATVHCVGDCSMKMEGMAIIEHFAQLLGFRWK
jgi:hypothetical protein